MRSHRGVHFLLCLASVLFRELTAWHSSTIVARRRSAWLPLFSTRPTTRTATQPSASLRELFPPSPLIRNGSLAVDPIHTLFYAIYGEGPLRALFLHGGPGAGCFPNHARFFDPTKHQVVLFDQRGCGKSTPSGCLVNQTLQDVVEDCEKLRKHLNIEQWDVVLGGSWGTTVAMAYVQDFPNNIRSLILRGVCALRQQEVDWLFADRPNRIDNPAWRTFCEAVDVDPNQMEYPRQALHGYYKRFVLSSNDTERQVAARAWMSWEFYNGVAHQIPPGTNLTDRNATMAALETWKDRRPTTSPILVHKGGKWGYQTASGIQMTQVPRNLPVDETDIMMRLRQGINSESTVSGRSPWPFPDVPITNTSRLPIQPLLTCFYSTNDDMCLNNRNLVEGIFPTNIPCIAIHGGADGICPPDTALDVLERWPTMELRIPVYGGHSMYDPYITHELVQATDRMGKFLMDLKSSASR